MLTGVGDLTIGEEAIAQMRDRGGKWAAYQNVDLSSSDIGSLRFLQYGKGKTYQEPPNRYPDTQYGFGWQYYQIGTVNLETGLIEGKE